MNFIEPARRCLAGFLLVSGTSSSCRFLPLFRTTPAILRASRTNRFRVSAKEIAHPLSRQQSQKTANESFTHDLTALLAVAGLKADHDAETKSDPIFAQNWTTVKYWSEATRYEFKIEKDAQDLYQAITNRKHGVLRWLRRYC